MIGRRRVRRDPDQLRVAARRLAEREEALAVALQRLTYAGEHDAALPELRCRHAAVGAAYRAAIEAAQAAESLAPGSHLDRLGTLRTRLEEHRLSASYASGLLLPTFVRTRTRAALGPKVPGLVADPPAPVDMPARYGLDLAGAPAEPVALTPPRPLPVRAPAAPAPTPVAA